MSRRKMESQGVRGGLAHSVGVGEVDRAVEDSGCSSEHQQTLRVQHVSGEMPGEKCTLEVDSVLLLIGLENVVVLDIAATEASSDTNDSIVGSRSTVRLLQQLSNLSLHSNIGVDDHVRAGLGIIGDVDGDGTPATLLEAVNHGSSKGTISTQDQAFTSLLHL